jgi:hypothetical protein
MAVTSVSTAHAAQTFGSCTMTAVAPVLSGTSLYGSLTVKCTALTAVIVKASVVELDYAAGATKITATSPEDLIVPVPELNYSFTVAKNATVTVCLPGGPLVAGQKACPTTTVVCANTEVGNEEYATKVTNVSPATVPLKTDRTLPTDNKYAC